MLVSREAFSCHEHTNLLKVGKHFLLIFLRLKVYVTLTTTSILTAAKLIYAFGAGITAAAGTRLALQLILVKGFKLYSFQLQDSKEPRIVIYCHYLPVSGLGNLRACCLPWMW